MGRKADDVGFQKRRTSMKTIVSALIALSLITAIAAPASALDSKEFWQQQDRSITERLTHSQGPRAIPAGPDCTQPPRNSGSCWVTTSAVST